MILVDSCGWLELLAFSPPGDVYRPALAKADELVVPLDAALALEAARLGPATGLPCADSIIYATALHCGSRPGLKRGGAVPSSPRRARQRHSRLLHTSLKVPWQHSHTDREMNVALTIKNAEVERLATEVAQLTGETKTQAIKVALEERRRRLTSGIDPAARAAGALQWLETEVWPHVPPELRGRPHDPHADDEILGYGPDGV